MFFINESAIEKLKRISPYIIGGGIGASAGILANDPEVQQFVGNTIDNLQYKAGEFFAHHPQAALEYLPNSLLLDPDFLRGAASEYVPTNTINSVKEFVSNTYNSAENYLNNLGSENKIPTAYEQGLSADQVNQIVDPNSIPQEISQRMSQS